MDEAQISRLAVVGLIAASLVTGCGVAPAVNRHLLPPASLTERTSDKDADIAIQLAQVQLPSYLQDAAIDYLTADGMVGSFATEHWAEDPQQAITHVLGSALRDVAGMTVIYEPWPGGLESSASVTISIHQLLGALGGETRLVGQFMVVTPRQVLKVRDFDLREPVVGADTTALLRSYSRALSALAVQIAEQARAR